MRMSIEEAKKVFILMNCSKFVMARENPQIYESYIKLNISEKTELMWKEDLFSRYYEELKINNFSEKIWVIFNRMYDLVECTKNYHSILKIQEVLKLFRDSLTAHERIIIAETINGRKNFEQRSGLIFLSYDLGYKEIAKEFSEICLEMLKIESNDKDLINRVKRAKNLCHKIINELSL